MTHKGVPGVLEAVRHYLDVTPDEAGYIIVALAVAVAKQLDDEEPLWLILAGPSGSGKTEAIRLVALVADSRVDELTRAGLLSWTPGRKAKRTGLLAQIPDVAFVTISDFSTVVTMGDREARARMFGMLRVVYDGRVYRSIEDSLPVTATRSNGKATSPCSPGRRTRSTRTCRLRLRSASGGSSTASPSRPPSGHGSEPCSAPTVSRFPNGAGTRRNSPRHSFSMPAPASPNVCRTRRATQSSTPPPSARTPAPASSSRAPASTACRSATQPLRSQCGSPDNSLGSPAASSRSASKSNRQPRSPSAPPATRYRSPGSRRFARWPTRGRHGLLGVAGDRARQPLGRQMGTSCARGNRDDEVEGPERGHDRTPIASTGSRISTGGCTKVSVSPLTLSIRGGWKRESARGADGFVHPHEPGRTATPTTTSRPSRGSMRSSPNRPTHDQHPPPTPAGTPNPSAKRDDHGLPGSTNHHASPRV